MKARHQDFTNATAVAPELFGDYSLLIDEALDGDPRLKERVAAADAINRGGLQVLQNALRNRGVVLVGKLADVLASCVADQAFWEAKQDDLDRIHRRPNGRFQVQVTVNEVRYTKTFDDLSSAQNYRDRMLLLEFAIEAENREVMASDK